MHGGIDPTDHETWMRADRPMMAAAHGLIVFKAAAGRKAKVSRWRLRLSDARANRCCSWHQRALS
jgi:hypothetical protein